MSSSSASTPSKMARATDSGEAFGMRKPRVISVSVGPVSTACTLTPRGANSARSDCVRLKAAAFDTAYAGVTGNGATAIIETLLTIAPLERDSSGRKACVMPYGPKD
jgi:hypothetical protein